MRTSCTALGRTNANFGLRNFRQQGITLIELLVVIAIMGILATAAMPLTRMTVKRTKEIELRSNLRILRTAIDAFKKDCIEKKLSTDYCKSDQDNYPESIEQLTEPLTLAGSLGGKTRKYLRRIPRDPMTELDSPGNTNNWGLRSYNDPPDSTQWGGGNVFDVYSKSDKIALDGSKYSTW
ncbi:MAG: type II secretion system protein [Betaproteobacteria bacterium]